MTAEELHRHLSSRQLGFQGYLILRNLTESPESAQWLAEMLGSSLVNTYAHLNRMEDRKLVLKRKARGHRSMLVNITDEGRKLLEEVEKES